MKPVHNSPKNKVNRENFVIIIFLSVKPNKISEFRNLPSNVKLQIRN